VIVDDQTIETSCLFDPSKLNSTKNTFSGRINSDTNPPIENNFVFDNGAIVTSDNGNNLIPD
jgi:hypothetical protein